MRNQRDDAQPCPFQLRAISLVRRASRSMSRLSGTKEMMHNPVQSTHATVWSRARRLRQVDAGPAVHPGRADRPALRPRVRRRADHRDPGATPPNNMNCPPTLWPKSPRIVLQCAFRASNGLNHLGLRVSTGHHHLDQGRPADGVIAVWGANLDQGEGTWCRSLNKSPLEGAPRGEGQLVAAAAAAAAVEACWLNR